MARRLCICIECWAWSIEFVETGNSGQGKFVRDPFCSLRILALLWNSSKRYEHTWWLGRQLDIDAFRYFWRTFDRRRKNRSLQERYYPRFKLSFAFSSSYRWHTDRRRGLKTQSLRLFLVKIESRSTYRRRVGSSRQKNCLRGNERISRAKNPPAEEDSWKSFLRAGRDSSKWYLNEY